MNAAERSPAQRHADVVATPASDVMSQPVMSVSQELCVGDALTAMVASGLRHLVVVDDGSRCLGIITDRAIASAWATDPTALTRQSVRALLDSRPAIVGRDALVQDVARTMFVDGVDAVAVIDRSGHAVGIVTGSDLVALMATCARDEHLLDE